MFSSPVTLTSNRCFFDKLQLANSANSSDIFFTTYQPLYPGICRATNDSSMVLAYLDPRDFRPTLSFFTSIDSVNLLSVPDMELSFLPLVPLLPIRDPLGASGLTLNLEPRMESFDVDHNTNRVILHFTDYVDLATFEPSLLVLTDPLSGNALSLSADSAARGLGDDIVRTVCVTLEDDDLEALQNLSICSTIPDNCACYFSSGLIATHSNVSVLGIPSSLPLPVSIVIKHYE